MTVAVIGAETGTFVPDSSGMRVELDQKTLSVTLPQLLTPEITKAFARMLWKDLAAGRVVTNHPDQRVLSKQAIDVHGSAYPPLLALHWGLTPSMMGVFDGDLLPSFAYFRIYFEEDVCRVHVDRAACQFSMSLTLASSDFLPWALSIGTRPVAPDERVAEDSWRWTLSLLRNVRRGCGRLPRITTAARAGEPKSEPLVCAPDFSSGSKGAVHTRAKRWRKSISEISQSDCRNALIRSTRRNNGRPGSESRQSTRGSNVCSGRRRTPKALG